MRPDIEIAVDFLTVANLVRDQAVLWAQELLFSRTKLLLIVRMERSADKALRHVLIHYITWISICFLSIVLFTLCGVSRR